MPASGPLSDLWEGGVIKLVDRYLIRELFVPFLIGTVMVVLMFQANTYMGLAKELQLKNVPLSAVFQEIFYQTPLFLNMTLPIGMALATSLTMSRIARESELTAMRSAGLSIFRVIIPVACFGLLVSALHFCVVEYVMPPSLKKAADLQAKIGVIGYTPNFSSNKPLQLGKYAASLGQVSRTEGSMDMDIKSVLLIDRPDNDTTNITTAETASYRGGVWSFHHGYYMTIHKADLLVAEPKNDFLINEPIRVDDMFAPPSPDQMGIKELREAIGNASKTGADVRQYQISLYDKFFVPLSCFVFSFVSPMMAILFAKTGGFAGVLLSFVMALAYYNVYVVCTQILVKVDSIPPLAISACPDALFVLLGLWAVRRLE